MTRSKPLILEKVNQKHRKTTTGQIKKNLWRNDRKILEHSSSEETIRRKRSGS